MICTFFGHSDCYSLDAFIVQSAIEELIQKGVDSFYVGHQGYFDSIVFATLKKLKEAYPHISISVVLAYMPTQKSDYDFYGSYSIFPEGIEEGPPRFAIERRNRWMIERAQYCLCYITHNWGGAYKFVKRAKNKGLEIVNLGNMGI